MGLDEEALFRLRWAVRVSWPRLGREKVEDEIINCLGVV
jgi:hypothetical protein